MPPSTGEHTDANEAHAAIPGEEFDALLDRRAITMVFQPVVDLRSGEIVGLEALARGPVGTALEEPHVLFAVAARRGRTAELDWVCRAAAFAAVLEADLPPALSLFINTEPESHAADCPPDLTAVVARAESLLRVFVEVNDRALATDPAGLLAAVDRARELGWGVAIDDVGSSRAPVAMLPVVRADMAKLDLQLLRQATDQDASAIVLSLLRHLELTGASLLVEGIEDEADARWARTMGAVYGQGRYLGEPGPLAESYPFPRLAVPLVTSADIDLSAASPFDFVADYPVRRVDRADLNTLGHLFAEASQVPGESLAILACSGRDAEATKVLHSQFPTLAADAPLRVVFGTGLPPEPLPGLRGVRIHPDDPLAHQRFLIILSESRSLALLSRHDPRAPQSYSEVVTTQDATAVHAIARHLIRRLPRTKSSNDALTGPSPLIEPEPEHVETTPNTTSTWRTRLRKRA